MCWLDAPVGDMASFKNLCERIGVDFDEFFKADSEAELYHFIGKDILYFHALFWPAMLKFSGHRAPHRRVALRLSHRRRPKNVEIARHLYHRRLISSKSSTPNGCATTSLPSSAAVSKTSI